MIIVSASVFWGPPKSETVTVASRFVRFLKNNSLNFALSLL